VLASGSPTVASGPLLAKFFPLAQTYSYHTGLLLTQTSQKAINVIFLFTVLNPYRLAILFIAFIHIVCCLKIYLHENIQMGFVLSEDVSRQM